MYRYIFKNGKRLRCGFTTGACAAAAAKAATLMLLGKDCVDVVGLKLPELTEEVRFEVLDARVGDGSARAAVKKDAGDDIDVTNGVLVYAEVMRGESQGMLDDALGRARGPRVRGEAAAEAEDAAAKDTVKAARNVGACTSQVGRDVASCDAAEPVDVTVEGGAGIGRVTKAGLDRPVGDAAINSAPRAMIVEAVRIAAAEAGYQGRLCVVISVPGGEEIAARTFNPVLGIEGGISILGTTGIVEPMSNKALVETIRSEISVKSHDFDALTLVPGNQGMHFATQRLDMSASQVVKCSNFWGEALDMAVEAGVKEINIVGNVGKLIKLAGGIFDTHSRDSDARMDIMIRCALRAGAPQDVLKKIDGCVTTDAALAVLGEAGWLRQTMDVVLERCAYYVGRRLGEDGPDFRIHIFSNDMKLLGKS